MKHTSPKTVYATIYVIIFVIIYLISILHPQYFFYRTLIFVVILPITLIYFMVELLIVKFSI